FANVTADDWQAAERVLEEAAALTPQTPEDKLFLGQAIGVFRPADGLPLMDQALAERPTAIGHALRPPSRWWWHGSRGPWPTRRRPSWTPSWPSVCSPTIHSPFTPLPMLTWPPPPTGKPAGRTRRRSTWQPLAGRQTPWPGSRKTPPPSEPVTWLPSPVPDWTGWTWLPNCSRPGLILPGVRSTS